MGVFLIPAPGADDAAIVQKTVAEWTTLVGAAIDDRSVTLISSGQTDGAVTGLYRGEAAYDQHIDAANAVPD